jgi:hypothetical protein
MTYESQVLNVPVAHLLDAAEARALSVGTGQINQNSMLGLHALQAGALGELVFMEYLDSLSVEYVDESAIHTTHDIRTVSPSFLIDIKTKERGLSKPREDWDATVSDYLIDHQLVDFYAFVSLRSTNRDRTCTDMNRFQSADIWGTMTKKDFLSTARLIKRGERDGDNYFQSKIDMWNVSLLELTPPKLLKAAV